jgi:hypothetical protein
MALEDKQLTLETFLPSVFQSSFGLGRSTQLHYPLVKLVRIENSCPILAIINEELKILDICG